MPKSRTHEEFIEELKLKNEQYRNGEFSIEGTFTGVDTKIHILTKYGLCSATPYNLLKGHKITILAAVNPTEYFKNICYDKFGVDGNDDLSKVEYTGCFNKIIVIDKDYGEYEIGASYYLRGKRNQKKGFERSAESCRHDKQYVISKIRELHPDLEFDITDYKNNNQVLIVKTKYGLTRSSIKSLLKGYKPDIRTSLDKNQYFRNMVIDKFGVEDYLDLSQINYQNNRSKIKVVDKDYGEYWVEASSFMLGARHRLRSIQGTAKAQRNNVADVVKKIQELHPEITFDIGYYKSVHEKIYVKGKYGDCYMTIRNLLDGCKPSIQTALNPTEYFINQAKEVHGDKYDYSLTNYKTYDDKVTIIGPNGIFKIRATSHLNGSGCLVETRERINQHIKDFPPGWSSKNWHAAALRSKHFTGYKVYFIECWDNETEERFYKIGRTFTEIAKRFRCYSFMPYNYNILYTIELDDAKRICELEQEYKNKHREFKYVPKKEFRGMHECFSKIIYI